MSTPPEHPSASPYQPPSDPQQQSPQGPPPYPQAGPHAGPQAGPQAGGQLPPVPPQHNPYAQSSPYGPQAPPAPQYYAPVAPAPQPGAGGRSGAGRAVLWAAVGAAVASALWGGGVLLLGKDSDAADLHGYTAKSDLCRTADLTAFATEYPKADDDPTTYTVEAPSLDTMSCNKSLKKDSSTYSDAYLSISADLHKKTDPGPEFADTWLGYRQRGAASTYAVKAVSGFGDQAYLVTQDTVTADSEGHDSGSREVTLAVRDGWMTYSMTWSAYASSLDTSPVATISQATQWVETSTKATLPKLK